MLIYLNNQPLKLDNDSISVAEFLTFKGIKSSGTAVSLNDRLIPHSKWEETSINKGDRLLIISAAFGG